MPLSLSFFLASLPIPSALSLTYGTLHYQFVWWHFASMFWSHLQALQTSTVLDCDLQITSPAIARDSTIATISSMYAVAVRFPFCRFHNFCRKLSIWDHELDAYSTWKVPHNLYAISHPITFTITGMIIANNNQPRISWPYLIASGSFNSFSPVMYSSNSFPLRTIVHCICHAE